MTIQAPTHNDDALADNGEIVETDAGPSRVGKSSRSPLQRRCIAKRQSDHPDGMMRFVCGPDGAVVPDLNARLPGRGAWVTSDRIHIETAMSTGAFSRAFKKQVKVSPDLPDQVQHLLERSLLDRLGLGQRAGDIISGFEQVRESVRGASPACLIEAGDSAEDGRNKLLGVLRARNFEGLERSEGGDEGQETSRAPEIPVLVGCFTSDQLGMALGRERVIHACMKRGRFAQAWVLELARLAGFRSIWPAGWLDLGTRIARSKDPSSFNALQSDEHASERED